MKQKKSKKKWLLIGAIALIVIIIIIGKMKGEKAISVNIEHPKRNDIEEIIPATGKIQPVVEVKISPDVSGEIIELNVKEGDKVNKGDLLIKIKQDVYISAVDRALASLNAVKAQCSEQKVQLSKIQLSYNRNKTLYEQKSISSSEYEASTAEYNAAQEQVKAALFNVKSSEAALKEARENLIKTTIYAPMSGIISKLSVELGERVVGTSQMAGTEMLRIANLNEMEVLVDVNENDIIRLKQNDTASIEVDAYPNRKFKGIVTQIANSSKNSGSATTITDQVTNFEVKILILSSSYSDLLSNNPIPFRPGMSASVSINTEKHTNVLSLPLQSVTARSGLIDSINYKTEVREQVFLYNAKTKKVTPVLVKTGIQNLDRIEILSGITDSSLIVTGPYSAINKDLKNNSYVEQQKKEK